MSDTSFYLIEKQGEDGQPPLWFRGVRGIELFGDPGTGTHLFDAIEHHLYLCTSDVHEAIEFRTEEQAVAVWRLLPKDWQRMFIITEHLWFSK